MIKNLYDENIAKKYEKDPLKMRIYTSRLIGVDDNLVLHGGGNTSVKTEDYLFVKGSGWDLSSIEEAGFPAVRLDALKEMAKREKLSDSLMVKEQKEAMRDKSFPNPSIEAILHAVIPCKFVDHTHADAVVTITNTPNGKDLIKDIYGDAVLIIDYVMPGFILAKEIYEKTKGIDWDKIEAIILLNHGVFTFDDDAKKSYDKMIDIVNKAEKFLEQNANITIKQKEYEEIPNDELLELEKEISVLRGKPVKAKIIEDETAKYFSSLENMRSIIKNGPLTPEHVIRTKPFPLVIEDDINQALKRFVKEYKEYFDKFAKDEIMLDPAPRYAVYKNRGVITFGSDEKETKVLQDIVSHTIKAMLKTQMLGGWKSLKQKDIFDMEYWELEQAKLRK